jgi:hypothetical protein
LRAVRTARTPSSGGGRAISGGHARLSGAHNPFTGENKAITGGKNQITGERVINIKTRTVKRAHIPQTIPQSNTNPIKITQFRECSVLKLLIQQAFCYHQNNTFRIESLGGGMLVSNFERSSEARGAFSQVSGYGGRSRIAD